MSAEDILGAMGEPSATGASSPPPTESTEGTGPGAVSLLKPNLQDQDDDDFDEVPRAFLYTF